MEKASLRIHYLYHSGFAVETPNHFLIFDYFNDVPEGTERSISNGVISEHDIITKKDVLVFSSHGHYDHFNPVIFNWEKYNPNIQYILSSDIELTTIKSKYHSMALYKSIKLDNITIKTFGSTDIGVSFLVNVDGISIFHAGDLNWWHWKDDTNEERKAAEENFKYEIEKILNQQVDIAFFPVDPRLEEFYYIGAEYFIQKVKPEILVPMHFGDNLDITNTFSKKVKDLSTVIVEISRRGQEILI
jgi:L-ascorbate metabolism protein UlaG (beta-lactamase superfamily)